MPEHVSFRTFAYSILAVIAFGLIGQAFALGVCWQMLESHRDGGHRNAVHWTEIRDVKEDIKRLESLHGSDAGTVEPIGSIARGR